MLELTSCQQATPTPVESIASPALTVFPTVAMPAIEQEATIQCQHVSAQPTPDASAVSLFPRPGEWEYDHLLGPDLAPATIVVYSDFACPTCAALAEILKRLAAEYPDDLLLVYRHFPILTAYPNSGAAVRAAEAAHAQDKFWAMHNALFENQAEWAELDEAALGRYLVSLAGQLGLDSGQFESDLVSSDVAEIPVRAFESGLDIGLPGAPLLLVNGQIYTGPINYSSLAYVVGLIALGERQFSSCPEMTIDPARRYFATLKTEKGEVLLRLYADKAPATVNSFIFLARNGWYENITFHRVIPGYVAQTGDPSGTGAGNPGYLLSNEITSGLGFDRAGLVGMSNSGPDTNGSQFFITLGPAPHLDGNYTIFGEVVSGLEIVESLSPRDVIPGQYAPPGDRLLGIVIEER